MSITDHLELGPNCPSEDSDCATCEEFNSNGCRYSTAQDD